MPKPGMTLRCLGVGFVAFHVLTCFAQGDDSIKLDQLRTNCTAEIERGNWYGYTTLRDIKMLEYKLLAWYRVRDSRPHYVDNALCWARASTDRGVMWVLAHMATNPRATRQGTNLPWSFNLVSDAPNTWLVFFATPPKNQHVYSQMRLFRFQPEEGWHMYDSGLRTNDWQAALGEKPAKTFSRPVQRPPAIRSAQETNHR